MEYNRFKTKRFNDGSIYFLIYKTLENIEQSDFDLYLVP